MDEGFEIPLTYLGKEMALPARLLAYGHSYKIEVTVQEMLVHFERDDEGAWRALISNDDLDQNKTIDRGLLQAVAASLDELFQ